MPVLFSGVSSSSEIRFDGVRARKRGSGGDTRESEFGGRERARERVEESRLHSRQKVTRASPFRVSEKSLPLLSIYLQN